MKNFKSIKWKLAIMFALCITAIMSVVCFLHIASMIYGEKQDFENTVNTIFTEDFIRGLSAMAEAVDYTVESADSTDMTISTVESDNTKKIYDAVWAHSGELGINSSRFMCILDASGTPIYCTSAWVLDEGVEKTAAVMAAANGNIGISTSLVQKYSDYALALNSGESIVYIKDTGDKLFNGVKDILFLYLRCLVLAVILSVVAGGYLAGSVTVPLKRMNEWAKQLADGNLSAKTDIAGSDELSELSESLMHMAHNIDATNTEVKNEKTKLETILQAMTDGLLAFNTEGRLIHCNSEAKRLLGRNYLDDIQFDSFFKEINANITIGDLLYMKPEGDIERSITIDKERSVVMNFKTFSLNNKTAGIVVVLHDITKQEKLEQSRRVFVADVSHELRTPITTIKSYAETLLDSAGASGEFMTRFLGVIAAEADRMARLISDLLTLSSLDNKQNSYKIPEEIDVRSLIEAVTERLRFSAKKKDQTLCYSPINDVPLIVGDPDALERVIINIVGNAVKYTQEGGRIDIYSSKVYNDICIKVADNGIGIPEENLPHIYDRFYRVDKARSRDTGGTGLGLAIAKQTIETAFKGKIKITSEAGKGTEVSITIPVAAS
ncbi:MAG: HAMP domain-containing protein [Clostridia bacterium]|nr:HAMP domain-containing protein [Clostridia bacterium]